MRIIADENIPLLADFFSYFGEIVLVAGREISHDMLVNADILLVRSVTKVNKQLLEGTSIKFVGTCTIGTDHLDIDYLDERSIGWSNASGCNARSVVDYVLGCLLVLAEQTQSELQYKCFGIIGVGEVGSRLASVLVGLGFKVLLCDPPRAKKEGSKNFVEMSSIISECDVISVHTPFISTGVYATHHLLHSSNLCNLKAGAWLINTSRGVVINNNDLRQLLLCRDDLRAVLDVWESEPVIDVDLAGLCTLATPHIAGYSLEGKWQGTEQIYQAVCRYFDEKNSVSLKYILPSADLQSICVSGSIGLNKLFKLVCHAVYDPRGDTARFLHTLGQCLSLRGTSFDCLRKNYPVRREIPGIHVCFTSTIIDQELTFMLDALGVSWSS
ncbi:UNVERIFIED_CONTAM: hypothetical protein GTU68_008592 [Idotea baltica]|nr:hypothetical protein [Idotea baltica]